MSRWCRNAAAFGLAIAIALQVTVARADPTPEAKAHFDAGVALLSDPEGARYEEAYNQFEESFRLSGSPVVLGNLGLCAMKLERDGEAIESYTRYLAEVADINAEERAQIERDLQTLRVSAVTVEISVERTAHDDAASVVDTRTPVHGASFKNSYPVPSSSIRLVLHPGRHRIALRVGDREADGWDFVAAPGEALQHAFIVKALARAKLPPAATPHSLAGPGVVLGLGVAGLVAGAVLGVVTLGKVHGLEEECPGGACPQAGAQADIDAAHAFVRATDFTLLGGGVVAAAGMAWLLWAVVDRPTPKAVGWFGGASFDGRAGLVTVGTAF